MERNLGNIERYIHFMLRPRIFGEYGKNPHAVAPERLVLRYSHTFEGYEVLLYTVEMEQLELSREKLALRICIGKGYFFIEPYLFSTYPMPSGTDPKEWWKRTYDSLKQVPWLHAATEQTRADADTYQDNPLPEQASK